MGDDEARCVPLHAERRYSSDAECRGDLALHVQPADDCGVTLAVPGHVAGPDGTVRAVRGRYTGPVYGGASGNACVRYDSDERRFFSLGPPRTIELARATLVVE